MLKLTSGKTLALNDVLHVPNIRSNLVSIDLLGKMGVKVSFEFDKFVMTKNNIFVEKGFCNQVALCIQYLRNYKWKCFFFCLLG